MTKEKIKPENGVYLKTFLLSFFQLISIEINTLPYEYLIYKEKIGKLRIFPKQLCMLDEVQDYLEDKLVGALPGCFIMASFYCRILCFTQRLKNEN